MKLCFLFKDRLLFKFNFDVSRGALGISDLYERMVNVVLLFQVTLLAKIKIGANRTFVANAFKWKGSAIVTDDLMFSFLLKVLFLSLFFFFIFCFLLFLFFLFFEWSFFDFDFLFSDWDFYLLNVDGFWLFLCNLIFLINDNRSCIKHFLFWLLSFEVNFWFFLGTLKVDSHILVAFKDNLVSIFIQIVERKERDFRITLPDKGL